MTLIIRFFAIAVLSVFEFVGDAQSGEHRLIPAEGGEAPQCALSGDIVPADVARLRENAARGCRTLFVSSPGGDVDSALALGRIVREAEMAVVVERGGKCASACVFLYAGGVTRAPYGPVLIHRPYIQSPTASFSETQQQFAAIGLRAKAFLREVNVNEGLFDRMMTISPEKALPLSLKDMDALGMGLQDQVYSEFADNRRAAQAGMTRKEFLEKNKQTEQYCGAFSGIVPTNEIESRRRCWQQRFPEYFLSP